jgi:hypothetical protein
MGLGCGFTASIVGGGTITARVGMMGSRSRLAERMGIGVRIA